MTNSTSDEPPPSQKTGYRRPPVHTRFQKGVSGNPKGRARGQVNLKTDLQQEMAERITLREGERQIRITKQRAMVKSTIAKAIKGDTCAQAKAFDLLIRILGIDEEQHGSEAISVADQAILTAFIERNRKG
jgi:hypothetical protein